jgi:hypothetical protein
MIPTEPIGSIPRSLELITSIKINGSWGPALGPTIVSFARIGPGGVNAIAWRLENAGQSEGGRGIGRPANNFLFFYLRRLFFGQYLTRWLNIRPEL